MLRDFDEWSATLAEASSLEGLRGSVIAIEAADYVSKLLTIPSTKEPLLAALGGLPFRLRSDVLDDLRELKSYDITPIFVFPGLDTTKTNNSLRASEALARNSQRAWTSYDQHDPEGAVRQFGEPFNQQRVYRALIGANDGGDVAPICAEDMFRLLQTVLREAGIGFQVAPYSAWAQLAYLEKQSGLVDAIVGSSEILLFDVDKIITSLQPKSGEFAWVRKQKCLADLGVTPEVFLDACLLSGSTILQTLPQLDSGPPRKAKIRAAVELLNNHERKGNNVCVALQGDAQTRDINYTDKFRRSLLSVKHHVVLTTDGKVEPFKVDEAPSDVHEFIGQRLPDEIYFYLSKGAIGPRILNWRASAEIMEPSPLDGGNAEEYRTLVRDQLTPIRATALSSLSHSLHRFYQHKDINVRCWFDREGGRAIGLGDVGNPTPILASWNVRAEVFGEQTTNLKGCGPLGFIIRSLKDTAFAAKTVTKREFNKPLQGKEEILYNTLGRFLQLREYVDSNHCLTPWGEVLEAAIAALEGRSDLEEPTFIAIELARLGHLTHNFLFPGTSGAPSRGTDEDRRNCLLVARVGCFATLRHQAIGYTGPLNRHLLAYHSFVDAMRKTLRDLAEVCLTTLLLNGDAKRDREDLTDLSLELPFLIGNDCALGIAVCSYLDDISGHPEPTSAEAKSLARERGPKDWFPTSVDLAEDVHSAFKLWDAVFAGAGVAGDKFKDRKVWDEANEWLSKRR